MVGNITELQKEEDFLSPYWSNFWGNQKLLVPHVKSVFNFILDDLMI